MPCHSLKSVRRRATVPCPLHIPFHILNCVIAPSQGTRLSLCISGGTEPQSHCISILSSERLCMPTAEGWPTLLESLHDYLWNLYYDFRAWFLARFCPRYLARRRRWTRVKVRWNRVIRRLHRSWARSAAFALHLYRIHRIARLARANNQFHVPVPRYFP